MATKTTRRLMSMNPHEAGLAVALVYGAIAVFVAIIALLVGVVVPGQRYLIGVAIVAPFLYALFAYIWTLIGVSIFNWAAQRIGGIQITVTYDEEHSVVS